MVPIGMGMPVPVNPAMGMMPMNMNMGMPGMPGMPFQMDPTMGVGMPMWMGMPGGDPGFGVPPGAMGNEMWMANDGMMGGPWMPQPDQAWHGS